MAPIKHEMEGNGPQPYDEFPPELKFYQDFLSFHLSALLLPMC